MKNEKNSNLVLGRFRPDSALGRVASVVPHTKGAVVSFDKIKKAAMRKGITETFLKDRIHAVCLRSKRVGWKLERTEDWGIKVVGTPAAKKAPKAA